GQSKSITGNYRHNSILSGSKFNTQCRRWICKLSLVNRSSYTNTQCYIRRNLQRNGNKCCGMYRNNQYSGYSKLQSYTFDYRHHCILCRYFHYFECRRCLPTISMVNRVNSKFNYSYHSKYIQRYGNRCEWLYRNYFSNHNHQSFANTCYYW